MQVTGKSLEGLRWVWQTKTKTRMDMRVEEGKEGEGERGSYFLGVRRLYIRKRDLICHLWP